MADETIVAVAKAMDRYADRWGRPARVPSLTLWRLYGRELGFTRWRLTCIGTSTIYRLQLHRALGARRWGAAPTYDRGTWTF